MAQSCFISNPFPTRNCFKACPRHHIVSFGFLFSAYMDFNLPPAKWEPVCELYLLLRQATLPLLTSSMGVQGFCRWQCLHAAYISSGDGNWASDGNQWDPSSLHQNSVNTHLRSTQVIRLQVTYTWCFVDDRARLRVGSVLAYSSRVWLSTGKVHTDLGGKDPLEA